MGVWQDISSSMLTRCRYDEETRTLEIQFKNGQIYSYSDVPEDEYEGLVSSSSAGAYFHENIKGNYSDRRTG